MRRSQVVLGAVGLLIVGLVFFSSRAKGSQLTIPDDCRDDLTNQELLELADLFSGTDDDPSTTEGGKFATCMSMMSDETFAIFYPMWANEEGFELNPPGPLEDVDADYDPITDPDAGSYAPEDPRVSTSGVTGSG